jgi:hypothetical protein
MVVLIGCAIAALSIFGNHRHSRPLQALFAVPDVAISELHTGRRRLIMACPPTRYSAQ